MIKYIIICICFAISSFTFSQKTINNNIVDGLIKIRDSTLYINYIDISCIPDSLYKCSNINIIYVINGHCLNTTKFFQSLSRFKKLSELYIQGFDIKFIPNNIKGLHNLKILRITDDSLTSITNSIKKSKINCLLLENDKIGKLNIKQQVGIFDAISAIPNLLELSLYGNELDTLHSGLKSSNLQKLNIGKNRFKYIQPVILYLITEKKLNILEIDFPTDTIKFLKFLDRIDRRIQINFTVEKYIYSNEYDEFCKRNPCIIGFGQFMYH